MGSTRVAGITEKIRKDATFSRYFYIKMKFFKIILVLMNSKRHLKIGNKNLTSRFERNGVTNLKMVKWLLVLNIVILATSGEKKVGLKNIYFKFSLW